MNSRVEDHGQPPEDRRQRILRLCGDAPRSAEELAAATGVSRRTITSDLRRLEAEHAEAFVGAVGSDHVKRFRFTGCLPHRLERPLTHVTEHELVALVAARGLLRMPAGHAAEPGHAATHPSYTGLLDAAMHALIERIGLSGRASQLAPEAVQVHRFAVPDEDPRQLATALAAVVTGDVLRFVYRNNRNEVHGVHVQPVRLALFEGEFHLYAWAAGDGDDDRGGRIKQYRVSRMSGVERCVTPPAGCPAGLQQRDVDREMRHAFRTHGSGDRSDWRTVVLAVAPDALPHLEGRTWGGEQHWDHAPPDLPPGWKRLTFLTSGLPACRHWVLGFGTWLRAEEPPELIQWLREQVTELARQIGGGQAASVE